MRVQSYPAAPGVPQTHTMTVMTGALGTVQMVDNAIDESAESVAAWTVGPPSNGFYVSTSDFKTAQPLPGSALAVRIDFSGYSLQVDCID